MEGGGEFYWVHCWAGCIKLRAVTEAALVQQAAKCIDTMISVMRF